MRNLNASHLPHRRLTRLGCTVPALAAGCWPLAGPCINDGEDVGWAPTDDTAALTALRAAWSAGIRLFDTADVYGHGQGERRLGRLLAEVPRSQILISTRTGYDRRFGHPYQARQMSRNLHRSLARHGTDYLDIYAFHSSDFGTNDRYLNEAVEQMQKFRYNGLIRAIGMRAPHEFAARWADEQSSRGERARRFLLLLDRIQPDVVSVRHNLLSPIYQPADTTVLDLAAKHGIDVLLKQVLGQGLLLRPGVGAEDPPYGPGDHRRRHRWFGREGRRLIWDGLRPIRERYGDAPATLARIAISYALVTAPAAVAMLGFRTAAQITANTQPGPTLTKADVTDLAVVGARVRAALDAAFAQ